MHAVLRNRPLTHNLLVVALSLVVHSVLADVLLDELKLSIVLNVPINYELSVGVFSAPSDLPILESERLDLHLVVIAALSIVADPFTLLVQVESAIEALKLPFTADRLLISLAILYLSHYT